MINHNLLLDNLLYRTIEVKAGPQTYKANFYEGDIFELWKEINKSDAKYPIIWLQSGYNISESANSGDSIITLDNVSFFLITKGDSNDYYKKRYKTTFNNMLYPLMDKFIKKLKMSKGITISDYDYITFPFNDISENDVRGMKVKGQTTTIIDIWDAIYVKFPSIAINKNCYNEYIIN